MILRVHLNIQSIAMYHTLFQTMRASTEAASTTDCPCQGTRPLLLRYFMYEWPCNLFLGSIAREASFVSKCTPHSLISEKRDQWYAMTKVGVASKNDPFLFPLLPE